ncbi:MAG: competence protein ComEC [Chloroflexota bacterium]|nr:competence protein ComEC [Chloroflexota bacterium]
MPLFWLCLSFTAGILVAALCPLSAWIWLAIAVVLLTAAWLEGRLCNPATHPLFSRPLFQIPFALLGACLALGGWRFQAAQPHIDAGDLAGYADGSPQVVTARIVSYPEESARSTRAVLQAVSLEQGDRSLPVDGKLELRLPGGFHLSYGDLMRLEGDLDPVLDEGQTSYDSYLARDGILSRMNYPQVDTLAYGQGSILKRCIYYLRERAQELIYQQIPFPESALLEGILLGIDWNIPEYLEEAYRSCGVLHIIAISGYNISLIANVIILLTRHFLSPGKAGAAAILIIALYTLLVGAEPAVVRAAIMGSLSIPAHYFGRRSLPLHSLVVAAAIMLAGNPLLLWNTGFQLSFMACLGLITMVDPILKWAHSAIEKRFSESTALWWQPILELVISTLVAQFSVSPVLLALNPLISVHTLAANLVLLPMQPVLMGIGGLAVISSFLLPPLGRLLSYLAWPFLYYNNFMAVQFGLQPSGEFAAPGWLAAANLVCFLVALAFFSTRQIRALGHPALDRTTPSNS